MKRWHAVAGATAIAGLAAALLAASPAGAQQEPTTSVPTTVLPTTTEPTTVPTTVPDTTVPPTTVPDTTEPPTTEPPEPDLLPISVVPATIHPGETTTISGEGCLSDGDPGDAEVFIFLPDDPSQFGELPADVNEDGSWSLQLTAAAEDAGHTFGVTATCFESSDSDNVVADYDFATITVLGTATTAKPPILVPAAGAAVAVTAEPTFTG